jgi:hypothetical protein
MVKRIEPESLRLDAPYFANGRVGCEAIQGLEPSGEVAGAHEVSHMLPKLVIAVVLGASDHVVA